MTSMLVAVLHKAEDKYTPVGEKPSALYIPDDAPEWELIAQLRGETYVDENPRKREIYALIKAGKTVRQISSQLKVTRLSATFAMNGMKFWIDMGCKRSA